MVTIKFKVTGQSLKLIEHKRFVAASDTINYFRCRVRFAEDWDIYTDRSIYFKNMSSDICKPGVFNDDGYCFVPWEVLANTGVIIASAVGVVMDGEEIAERLTTFPVELFVQVEEGQISVQPNEDPTPSQYEQFIANVQEYSEAAIQAKIMANNFAINAEASAGQAEASKNLAATSAQNASRSAAAANTSALSSAESSSLANTSALSSAESSSLASAKALLSQSWAEGGTGSRTDEDVNNAKYWSERSAAGQIQANWTETDSASKAFICNKPTAFPPEAHTHDDRYYTETETDALLLGKSDVTHLHDDRYYTESEINTALSAKADLENGKVPAAQLPAYVDDVFEYATVSSFPATGESGKIYIAQDTNLTYRWTGSGYAEISQSLALGETASTAFRGDQGKEAYDKRHEHSNKEILDATTVSFTGHQDISGKANVLHTHTAAQITNLGYGTAAPSGGSSGDIYIKLVL